MVALPTYPFQRQRFWAEARKPRHSAAAEACDHPLLSSRHRKAPRSLADLVWEVEPDPRTLAWLRDYRLRGTVALPAAGYPEMVLSAAAEFSGAGPFELHDVELERLAILDGEELPRLRIEFEESPDAEGFDFEVRAEVSLQARGRLLPASPWEARRLDLRKLRDECPDEVQVAELYSGLRRQGLEYAPGYQCLADLRMGKTDALGELKLPVAEGEEYQLHPVVLAAGLQVLGAVTSPRLGDAEVLLPVGMESVRVREPLGPRVWAYARMRPTSRHLLGDVDFIDEDGRTLAEVRGVLLRAVAEGPERWLYQAAWEEKRAASETLGDLAGRWLVLADRGGVGARLAELLRRQGGEPVLVSAGTSYRCSDEHSYQVDPRSPRDFRRLLHESGDLRGVVHLWSLDTTAVSETTPASLDEARDLGCTSVLHLVQALAGTDEDSGPTASETGLFLVTQGAVRATPEDAVSPAQAPIWGLGRVIGLEHPELRGTRIDLGAADSREVRDLLAELRAGVRTVEVALRRGRRRVPRLERFLAQPSPALSLVESPEEQMGGNLAGTIRDDASYLITGGLGGLGLTVARWMADRGARYLVLMGRREPSEAARGVIEDLRAAGARVRVARGDVVDQQDVTAALSRPDGEPPFGGLVHAAGVLDDRTLVRDDEGRFAAVMAPKVQGAWNLHLASAGETLDFFVLFSSTSALLGSAGQGNYAAANAFLDALAQYRRAAGLPALAIDWSAWSDVGMVSDAKRAANVSRHGVGWISPRQGVAVLGELLHASPEAGTVAVLPNLDFARVAGSLSGSAEETDDSQSAHAILADLEKAQLPERRDELVGEYLRRLLAEVLRIPSAALEMERPLHGHGIDSLMDIELRNRMRTDLGLSVPAASFLKGHSLGELAADVARRLEPDAAELIRHIEPLPRDDRFFRGVALSFAQQRLWFLDRLVPNHHFYNVPQFSRLTGRLEVPVLSAALQQVENRHETLRTTFADRDGEPVQVVRPSQPGRPLSLVDLTALGAEYRQREARRLTDEEALRPFDLARGPLLRSSLLRLEPEQHVLLLTMHHIVTDGWSLVILERELKAAYEAALAGEAPALPAPAVQYADFAAWQREVLSGETLERHLAFWRRHLGDDPPMLRLPTDRPRPVAQTFTGGQCRAGLPGRLVEDLRDLGRRQGTTLPLTILAGFLALLYRISGQRRILVGSSMANRGVPEVEGLVGFFVDNLVMSGDFSSDDSGHEPSYRQILERVREMAVEAYAHQDLPFEKLVDELGLPRDLSHNPLFQVVFNMQQVSSTQGSRMAGMKREPVRPTYRSSRFDLELHQWETTAGLVGFFAYDQALFDASTIARMVAHYRALLEAAARSPEAPLAELPWLGAGERHQLTVEWNDTTPHPDVSRHACVHELFAAQAQRVPDRVAVIRAGNARADQVTYGELHERSGHLACHLRRLGVGPESRVAIRMDRSVSMVTAVLGVLEAGGAYVPLDPGHPEERLRFMVRDASAGVMLTQGTPAPPPMPEVPHGRRGRGRSRIRRTNRPCGRSAEPGLRDVHLGLDRPAQRRGRHPPRDCAPRRRLALRSARRDTYSAAGRPHGLRRLDVRGVGSPASRRQVRSGVATSAGRPHPAAHDP